MLPTALDWPPIADPIVLFGYVVFKLVKHRREESVRQFTRATAAGVGLSIVIAVALFASTVVI